MTIEILFSDFFLFGERGNTEYIEKAFEGANIIKTEIYDEVYFKDNDVDFIFMGPMTEHNLERVANKLMPYKERIEELINKGTYFLVTSNAMEIFGEEIVDNNGKISPSLGIFNFKVKRNFRDRHSVAVMGEYNGYNVMGYIASFSEFFGIKDNHFLNVTRGYGDNRKANVEGIKKNNFYGTQLLGPVLVTNPPLIKEIKKGLTNDDSIPYEDRMERAYKTREELYTNNKEFTHQSAH